jgi:uncharacterized protein YegJ (DUF2314 family)
MERELIICIPGPWADRNILLRQIITRQPPGRFMLVGGMLADLAEKDHVAVDFCEADSRMVDSFRTAGQGSLSESLLGALEQHLSVLYLHFPLDIVAQRERILKFTRLIRELGGIAVKLESSGIAHAWEKWETRLAGSLFDLYCATTVLVGDEDDYYSCGMHHFGLPECSIPRTIKIETAAELMNRFNAWRINESPDLVADEVLSIESGSPAFRLSRTPDDRHHEDDLFYNPHGVWRLAISNEEAENRWKNSSNEPLFVAVSQNDEAMAAAYEKAKTTFPQFLAATKSESFESATNAVKLRIRDAAHSAELGEDSFTFLWVWNVREEGDRMCARVIELPKEGINDLAEGQDVRFSVGEVHDWMLREGPQAWGAYTMRVIRGKMSVRERLQHDSSTGILAYRDLTP